MDAGDGEGLLGAAEGGKPAFLRASSTIHAGRLSDIAAPGDGVHRDHGYWYHELIAIRCCNSSIQFAATRDIVAWHAGNVRCPGICLC